MKKLLGAATVACVLVCANQASASVIYQSSGTGVSISDGTALPGSGVYDVWLTLSDTTRISWGADWTWHWDTFPAPFPQPHSAYIEGNTSYGSAGGPTAIGNSFHWTFTIPDEVLYYFTASDALAALYPTRVTPGAEMFYWARPENASFGFYRQYFPTSESISYSLLVTRNGAIPEPATWAMMLMGIFGLGAALRRRQTAGQVVT